MTLALRPPASYEQTALPPPSSSNLTSGSSSSTAGPNDPAATSSQTPGSATNNWTPNWIVRTHNNGVQRVYCCGCLKITQTSNKIGDIVKIAAFSLINIGLMMYDVAKGAFKLATGIVCTLLCYYRRNTTTNPPASGSASSTSTSSTPAQPGSPSSSGGPESMTGPSYSGGAPTSAAPSQPTRTTPGRAPVIDKQYEAAIGDMRTQLNAIGGELARLGTAVETIARDSATAADKILANEDRLGNHKARLDAHEQAIVPLRNRLNEFRGTQKTFETVITGITDSFVQTGRDLGELSNRIGGVNQRLALAEKRWDGLSSADSSSSSSSTTPAALLTNSLPATDVGAPPRRPSASNLSTSAASTSSAAPAASPSNPISKPELQRRLTGLADEAGVTMQALVEALQKNQV